MVVGSARVAQAHTAHVPGLPFLVDLARQAGAGTEGEAQRLIHASLQLLAEQWSDAVRIRLVAKAPVEVARWLIPPRRSEGGAPPPGDVDSLAAAVADASGSPRPVARRTLEHVLRALAEVLPADAHPRPAAPGQSPALRSSS